MTSLLGFYPYERGSQPVFITDPPPLDPDGAVVNELVFIVFILPFIIFFSIWFWRKIVRVGIVGIVADSVIQANTRIREADRIANLPAAEAEYLRATIRDKQTIKHRRRRNRIIYAVTTLGLLAIVLFSISYCKAHAQLRAMRTLRNKVCDCPNQACADRASIEFENKVRDMTAPPDADRGQILEALAEMRRCEEKLQ